MKKLVLSLAIVGFGVFAMAQQTGEISAERKAKMEQKRAEHMAEMKKELNLTNAQVEKINALHAKHKAQNQELRQKNSEVAKQNRQQKEAEMKAILTPEQYTKWQEKKQERKQKMGEGKHGKGGKKGFNKDNKVSK
ncbi:MAG: hypothetical protein Q4G16_07155 [Cruoricaptor ignavus]|nr:hypothetical protein [Cruoricaptor ignavus]